MAQRSKSEIEFIQDTFSPIVTVSCSYDAEIICRKNNLTFAELVQPFCRLNGESKIFDPTNILYNISNLRIEVKDINTQIPVQLIANRLLNEAITLTNNAQYNLNEKQIELNDYKFKANLNTPWYESWRDCFLKIGYPSDHEFLKHFLACIFVVSTTHLDPIDQFKKLILQLTYPETTNTYPKCFSPNIYQYFVLLHDASEIEISKAHHFYESLKSNFGPSNCHLLQINSKQSNDSSQMQFDPWLKYVKNNINTINYQGEIQNNENGDHPLALKETQEEGHEEQQQKQKAKQHGNCLTSSDIDRIKIFMSEFVNRGLIPWAEKTIKTLYEQTQSKKSILKTFSFQKKLFGSSSSSTSMKTSTSNSTLNGNESNEIQLRKLGDLAFLFRLYDLAYNSYHTCKKEFEPNTIHLASSLEMCSIASFMASQTSQNTKSTYASNYIDEALILYNSICKIPYFTTRAIILSTECLKATKQLQKAANQYTSFNTTSDDSDIRFGLFYEQAALCYLVIQPMMIRKYAYNMSIAANRFGKCGQRIHALRAYNQLRDIYINKKWKRIKNNLDFLISRLYFNLGDLAQALFSIEKILQSKTFNENEIADITNEANLIKDYIQYQNEINKELTLIPNLLIPLVNSKEIIINLTNDEDNLNFSYAKDKSYWFNFEEKLYCYDGKRKYLLNQQQYYFGPQTDNQKSPLAFIDEPIRLYVTIKNPLSLALVLSQIKLLWKFNNMDRVELTNELNDKFDDIVNCDFINEIQMEPKDVIQLNFKIKPSIEGFLNITGIKYQFSLKDYQEKSLLGKQSFSIKGPRLNNTSDSQKTVKYGIDNRLNIKLLPKMPLLKIDFIEVIPSTLYCGQLECVHIKLTNLTQLKVKNLRVASNFMQNLCFTQLNKEIFDNNLDSHEFNCDLTTSTNELIHSFNELIINENEDLIVKLWIKAPNDVGNYKIDLMFYYENLSDEPDTKSNSVKYRVYKYSTEFSTIQSLKLKKITKTDTSKINSIVNFEIENQDKISYEIFQISSLSNLWESKCISNSTQILNANETISLNLMRKPLKTPFKQFMSKNALASNFIISFENEPMLKFIKNQENAFKIILFWKVLIDQKSKIGFIEIDLIETPTENIKSNLTMSIIHPSIVTHDFSTKGPCLIPISIELNNSLQNEQNLLIKVINTNRYLWIGNTIKYLNVLNSKTNVDFRLWLNKEGLYEIGGSKEDGIFIYLKRSNEEEYKLIKHLPLFNILIISK